MSKLLEEIRFDDIEFLMFVLDELADGLIERGRDVIKLTLGKAQEPLNPKIVKAYIDAIDDPDKRNLVYPEGLPVLRKKIANWYTAMGNKTLAKNVLINTGTSPFFKDLFRLLIEDGDEILLPYPYYSVYYVCTLLARAKVRYYRVNPDNMKIDLEDLKTKYNPRKTKFIVTCSPGNPYGNIISKNEFRDILSICSDYTYVIADEIYRNTCFIGDAPSILDVANKQQAKNIIVTNSFSKGFRMYTARIGFSILPDNLLKPYRVLLQHTLLTANPVEQFACVEALNNLNDVTELTDLYRKRNDYMISKLSKLDDIHAIPANGGFYLVIDCRKYMKKHKVKNSFCLAKDLLDKVGVAVVPGSDFGCEYGIRISFTSLRFNEAADRIYKYFSR